MIYYCIIPKNTHFYTISHVDFKHLKKIKCKYTIRNSKGKVLYNDLIFSTYPFDYCFKNNYITKDIYIELCFFDKEIVLEMSGTIDVLYKTKISLFGIGTGMISRNANSIDKKEIKSNIVKNCCCISMMNSTKIFIINPNPTSSKANGRTGILDYKIFDEAGNTVYQDKLKLNSYEMINIDIKQKIPKYNSLSREVKFYTFTSENNFNVFPITFATNNNVPTGCEHSQPKFNYFRFGPQNRKINVIKLIQNLF